MGEWGSGTAASGAASTETPVVARFVAPGSARRTSQFALCADPVRAWLSSAGRTSHASSREPAVSPFDPAENGMLV